MAKKSVNVILNPKHPKANHKQIEFFMTFLRNLASGQYSVMWYGGAIRGGKTFICLAIFVYLSRKYPDSRWYVVRKSFPDLERTAIPSLNKILKGSKHLAKVSKKNSDYYYEFKNGSRIYMMAENYAQDKDLDRFKGMECNGVLLEQAEELQYETYQKCLERAGSWYCDVQPPSLLLGTFNPAYNWLKKKIYNKWKAGNLPIDEYFQEALPDDNPHVTDDQWSNWEKLDDEFKKRFIKGAWEQTIEGTWVNSFDSLKHVSNTIKLDKRFPIIISFDFNVDPMTATISQTDRMTFFHILDEYRLADSNTPEMCEKIREDYESWLLDCIVTGDASGRARNSGVKGGLNQYQQIMRYLQVNPQNIKVPKANPVLNTSRSFINSILSSKDFSFKIHQRCKHTIEDFQFVEKALDQKGEVKIKKGGQNKYLGIDNAELGHLLDNSRYAMHITLSDLIVIPRS